jgi:hypothetical protein
MRRLRRLQPYVGAVLLSLQQRIRHSPNIVAVAGTDELLRSDLPVVEYFDVRSRRLFGAYVQGRGTSRSRLRTFAGCGRFTNTLPSKAKASAAKPGAIGSASARRSNRRKRTPKYWKTPHTFVFRDAFAFGLTSSPYRKF